MQKKHSACVLALVLFFIFQLKTSHAQDQQEERIFQVVLNDGSILSDAVIFYPLIEKSSWIVSLEDWVQSMDSAITVSPKIKQAKGFIHNEARTFFLDINQCQYILESIQSSYPCEDIKYTEDSILVPISYIEKWFDQSLKVDLLASKVHVTTRTPIPYQLKQSLSQKNIYQQGSIDKSNYKKITPEDQYIDGISIDQQLETNFNKYPNSKEFGLNSDTYITGELLKHDTQIYLNGDQRKLHTKTINMSKKEIDGTLLGPLKAKEYSLINISTPTLPLVSVARSGTGFVVSNYPLEAPSTFSSHDLVGALPQGWDVELYQNDILKDRKTADGSGLYEFKNLALYYGVNDFKLSFTGPHGEKREERQFIRIDSRVTQPGMSYYKFFFNQTESSLFNKADQRVGLQADRYLFGRTSLQVFAAQKKSVNGLDKSIDSRNLAVGATNADFGALSTLSFAINDKAAFATLASTQFPIKKSQWSLQHIRSFNYQNEWVEQAIGKDAIQQYSLGSNFVIPTSIAIGVTNNVNYNTYKESHYSIEYINRLSTNFTNLFFNHSTTYKIYPEAYFIGIFAATINSFIWKIRNEWNYSLNKLNSFQLGIERTFAKNIFVSFQYFNQFESAIQSIQSQIAKNFQSYKLGSVLSFDNKRSILLSAFLSTNLTYDTKVKKTYIDHNAQAQTGSITFRAYLDSNRNQQREPDEPLLEKVEFLSSASKIGVKTDAEGLARFTQLPAYQGVDFVVALSSIDDPFVKPKEDSFSVYGRPGKAIFKDVPFITVSHVEGFVVENKKNEKIGRKGLKLVFKTIDGKEVKAFRSDQDGYYWLEGVEAGKYIIELVQEDLLQKNYRSVIASQTVEAPEQGAIIQVPNLEIIKNSN